MEREKQNIQRGCEGNGGTVGVIKMKTKHEKATITASFSALARICGEDMLRSVLKARGKRKGSSIIIPGSVLLPVLSEAAKWKWERNDK